MVGNRRAANCRIKPLVQRFRNHDGLHRTPAEALKHGDPSAPENLFSPCSISFDGLHRP